jgi:hypothetical protein
VLGGGENHLAKNAPSVTNKLINAADRAPAILLATRTPWVQRTVPGGQARQMRLWRKWQTESRFRNRGAEQAIEEMATV